MKAKVIITAQKIENYGLSADGTREVWKKKGGREFEFEADDTELFNVDKIKEFCRRVCKNKSNSHARYEFVEYDMDFFGREDVQTEWEEFNSQ